MFCTIERHILCCTGTEHNLQKWAHRHRTRHPQQSNAWLEQLVTESITKRPFPKKCLHHNKGFDYKPGKRKLRSILQTTLELRQSRHISKVSLVLATVPRVSSDSDTQDTISAPSRAPTALSFPALVSPQPAPLAWPPVCCPRLAPGRLCLVPPPWPTGAP